MDKKNTFENLGLKSREFATFLQLIQDEDNFGNRILLEVWKKMPIDTNN